MQFYIKLKESSLYLIFFTVAPIKQALLAQ